MRVRLCDFSGTKEKKFSDECKDEDRTTQSENAGEEYLTDLVCNYEHNIQQTFLNTSNRQVGMIGFEPLKEVNN